jgi:hypothetical protein
MLLKKSFKIYLITTSISLIDFFLADFEKVKLPLFWHEAETYRVGPAS